MNLYPYLIAIILIQEVVFLTLINRLVNKLMSRNYHEYKMSDKLSGEKKKEAPLKVMDEPMEDLAHIF